MANLWICTRAQSFGQGGAQLHLVRYGAVVQGLCIRVTHDEVHAIDTDMGHVVDSI